MRTVLIALFVLLGSAVPAAAVELSGPLTQGGLVIGKVEPGSKVAIDGRPLRVDEKSGTFVFGLERDQRPTAALSITGPDGKLDIRALAIAPREWDIERIDGLPPRKVTPTLEDVQRIVREALLIKKARSNDSETLEFTHGFILPVDGRVSGRYGNQRILNGKPRQPHLGVDIAAPQGTPVVASAAGSVVLAESDLFYTGGTVAIDHGHGITTIYSHLARVDVAVGDHIDQGARLGTVGATGRATGPHLDWRINWFDVRLDPELVLEKPLPEQEDDAR